MDKATTENYVYILHAQGTNRFKIGHSVDPIKRQNAINNTSSPFPIKLIACYSLPDPYSEEQRLHREFHDRRVWGEWFEFDSTNQVRKLTSEKLGVVEARLGGLYCDSQSSRLPFILVDSLGDEQNNNDKIGITKDILKDMINVAINELETPCKFEWSFQGKIPYLQLLTGKYVSEIIYGTTQANYKNLQHHSPILSPSTTEDLSDLVNRNLVTVCDGTKKLSMREQRKLDPVNSTFQLYHGVHLFRNILIPVRQHSDKMPSLNCHLTSKNQHLRGIYAFSCWVFLDNCQSDEDDYINSLLS